MSFENERHLAQEADRNSRNIIVAPALGDLSLQPRQQIDLFLREYDIKLGQRKLPFRLPYESRDYSMYRRGFLKSLAARQSLTDEPHPNVKPLEAWADMGNSGRFPVDVMTGVKRWLPTLSYKKQPLVEGNGKRGRGAYYNINNDYYLNVIDAYQELEPALPDFPTAEEIYEIVRHLGQFGFVFKEHRVLTIDPALEIALESHKPNYRDLKQENRTIADFRTDALNKMGLLLEDKAHLAAFKKAHSPRSVESALAGYIYDLDIGERFFVRNLLDATLEPISEAGRLRLEAVDNRGMLLGVLQPSIAELSTDEDIEPAEETKPEAALIYDQSEVSVNQGEIKFKNELEEAMVQLVGDVARSTAITFLERFSAEKVYTPDQLKVAFPKLRKELVVSARDNNVLSRNRQRTGKGVPGLTLEETIRVMIYSDTYLQNMFTTRKYKRQIEDIIDAVITEETEAAEQSLVGDD